MQAGGTALPWADRKMYTALMLQRSIDSFREHTPARSAMFSDRGMPDTLAYARLIGLADVASIERACRRYRYAHLVFLAPPWQEIYTTDRERKQDFAEAVRTYKVIGEVYRELRYELCEIPKLSPRGRADFVLQQITTRD